MNNVFTYLKEYGSLTFREKKFSAVDSLILSQFCYLKVDGMVPTLKEGAEAVTLCSLSEHPDKEKLFADERFEKNNRRLFELMCESVRFRDIRLNHYVNIVDEEIGTQFSAMTMELRKNMHYIAFRGTDETIVGWKEDFCMAFSGSIPSQDYSVVYVTQVAQRVEGRLCLGGHSKGGNLAVYAALHCPQETADRIARIYSFDGPGFRPEVLACERFLQIRSRIRKFIPQSSVIGMVLQSQEKYVVVKSRAAGILQHDPYTWVVSEGDFVRAGNLYKGRRIKDKALNEWILSLSEEQIRRFVDNLFNILYASEQDNLIDFSKEWKQSLSNMVEAYKEMDVSEKKFMIRILGKLFSIESGMLLQEKK